MIKVVPHIVLGVVAVIAAIALGMTGSTIIIGSTISIGGKNVQVDEGEVDTDDDVLGEVENLVETPVPEILGAEGYETEPYELNGIKHVCYGHVTQEERERTPKECIDLFTGDLNWALHSAREFAGEEVWEEMGAKRQGVLAELSYMTGKKGLEEFKKLKAALEEFNWTVASKEIGNSLLSIQVGEGRVEFLMERML